MGVAGEGVGASPSRGGSKATGRFQRRLDEASAEVAAESAAAPRIAFAAAGETETGEACLSGGGATAGGLGGEWTKTMKKTWSDDQLQTAAASSHGGDGGPRQWTPPEDRKLERLVRECVFDFDLVAARFSSAGDVDCGGRGESHHVYSSLMMMLLLYGRHSDNNVYFLSWSPR